MIDPTHPVYPMGVEHFRISCVLQTIVYLAYCLYDTHKLKMKEPMETTIDNEAKRLGLTYSVVYDESVWGPEVEDQGTKMLVILRVGATASYYVLELDFTKDMWTGVYLRNTVGRKQINVFQPKFRSVNQL